MCLVLLFIINLRMDRDRGMMSYENSRIVEARFGAARWLDLDGLEFREGGGRVSAFYTTI